MLSSFGALATTSFAARLASARPAAAPYLGLPSSSPVTTPDHWITVPAFPGLTFDDPTAMTPDPRGERLYVAEREGRVFSFLNDRNAADTTVVLDLRHQTQGNSDSGMLSLAFHPDFGVPGSPNRGYFYVVYAYSDAPIVDERPGPGTPTRFRLSRFHIPDGARVADPADELVLIEQEDQNLWHMGGAMFFHPVDGFLYVTLGDEGGGRCQYGNCQRIDRDLFGGVLRIDVDRRGGDVSHPIGRQPQSGRTRRYFIPNDNPFVGGPGNLEEFYAIGLRSPHRMTHDAVDGLTWISDVGQSQREEIDLLARGANYQWNILEGTVPFRDDEAPPVPLIGEWTGPLYDYGRSTGTTLIGGHVYRGEEHFELYGKYVFADHGNGRIRALRYERTDTGAEFVAVEELYTSSFGGRSDGITSFGVDENDELYIMTLGEESVIHRLMICDKEPGDLPLTLSATGLFTDLSSLTTVPALIPYSVNSPLWSDGTVKSRWFSVPDSETIAFSANDQRHFPPGSVFVKHFELPVDESDPAIRRRLETRVLVAQADGSYYGISYRWRDDQTDADLLVAALTENIEVRRVDGSVREQQYRYPSPTDCLRCHTAEGGDVLGVKTRQLAGRSIDRRDARLRPGPAAVARRCRILRTGSGSRHPRCDRAAGRPR
ncbi:MAG: hypothetical protein E4H03_08455 [Myxococcales bacterium]|nr:MAG: hypothetical protein E4H03_08455 [Myxococcales bacterium]